MKDADFLNGRSGVFYIDYADTVASIAQQAAEGYADSFTTDEIDEGMINKYFTKQRAIDSISEILKEINDKIDELYKNQKILENKLDLIRKNETTNHNTVEI